MTAAALRGMREGLCKCECDPTVPASCHSRPPLVFAISKRPASTPIPLATFRFSSPAESERCVSYTH